MSFLFCLTVFILVECTCFDIVTMILSTMFTTWNLSEVRGGLNREFTIESPYKGKKDGIVNKSEIPSSFVNPKI